MRHKPPKHARTVQDTQALQMLRENYPDNVKAALLLCVRGGRVPKGCLLCGRRGAGLAHKVYIPDDVLALERQTSERPRLYALCPGCEATQPPVHTIAQKLGLATGAPRR